MIIIITELNVKYIIATFGTIFTYIFGTWDTALIVLVSFMLLDYLTGIIRAFSNKTISSNAGLRGIARKSLILVVLSVGVLLDRLLNSETWVFRTVIA